MLEAKEVLIRAKATSVNDRDWSLAIGKPFYIRLFCGLFKPNEQIPGVDVAGNLTCSPEIGKVWETADRFDQRAGQARARETGERPRASEALPKCRIV